MTERTFKAPGALKHPITRMRHFEPHELENVLAQLSEGVPMAQLAKALNCSWVTLDDALAREGWSEAYARARERGWHALAHECLTIADDLSEDAHSRRIRVDTRKWLLSKVLPKVYGDQPQVALQVNAGADVTVNFASAIGAGDEPAQGLGT